jgi:hypothetical protein
MWFKLFVLLRLPVSVICLFGYATALGVLSDPGMGFLGAAFVLVLVGFAFLAFASIRLFRCYHAALRLAWWLLSLELVGAVLLVSGAYIPTLSFDALSALGEAFAVGVVWTLPNAVILYSQRAKFADTKKLGL